MDERASATTATPPEAEVSLATYSEKFLRKPAALELGQRLWGRGLVTLSLGLPQHFVQGELGSWLGAHDTACEFLTLPQDGRTRFALLFPSSDGARWVDRALGGEGQIAHAQALTEAECGVLAYAVGRGLRELLPQVQLANIEAAQKARLDERFPSGVVWPLVLHTPLGPVDVRLVLSEQAAARNAIEADVQIVLGDVFEGELSFAGCSAGDVLLSDALPLTVTTTGLVGPVEVRILGARDLLQADLAGHTLRARSPARAETGRREREGNLPRRGVRVEFVIAQQRMSLLEIARFHRGEPLQLHDVPRENVSVLQDGKLRAEGSLIVHRGALGVRVVRVEESGSAREHDVG